MYLLKPSFEIINFPIRVLQKLELYGRVCYKSEERITNISAEKFCKMIKSLKHESVIEHCSATVRFICNRGFTHELVRHRLASYSQESTRYCNYKKTGVTFIIPPWVKLQLGEYTRNMLNFHNYPIHARYWLDSLLNAEYNYNKLLEEGWSPQQARGVLPIDLKTEIIITANLREWMHIFELRCSKQAHPQMQELMVPLREEFTTRLPILFGEE